MTATTETSAVDLLRKAREILSTEDRWTRDVWARSAESRHLGCDVETDSVEPTDPAACRWCLTGAVYAAAGMRTDAAPVPEPVAAALHALDRQVDALAPGVELGVESYNDSDDTTLADIHALIDRAVARLEAAP